MFKGEGVKGVKYDEEIDMKICSSQKNHIFGGFARINLVGGGGAINAFVSRTFMKHVFITFTSKHVQIYHARRVLNVNV